MKTDVKLQHPLLRIGLIIESLSGYGEKILTGISRYSQQKIDWRVSFFDRERDELLQLLQTWEGDGMISTIRDEAFLEAARKRSIPIINVTSRQDASWMASVTSDETAIGRMAAEHFLLNGFQNFASLRLNSHTGGFRLRAEGFAERLAAEGLATEHLVLAVGENSRLAERLSTLSKPLALFGITDRIASTAIEICWENGLKIPEDVAILGVGNYEQLCDLCSPTLSSIDVDMERRGYEAARLLDGLLLRKTGTLEHLKVQPLKIIERGSTAGYAYTDPDLITALRFIRANASRPILVADVVAATDVSRRTLESRFSQKVGISLHEQIRAAHFDLATRMLRSGDLSLQEIAQRSGFRSASSMVTLFKETYGQTPRQYRIQNRR